MKNSFAGLFQGSSSMSMPNFVWIRWTGSKLLQKNVNFPSAAPAAAPALCDSQHILTLNSIYSQTYERSINEWKIYLVTWYTDIVINCSFCRKFRLYYVFRAIKISKFSTAGIFRVKIWEVLIFFSPSDESSQTLYYPEFTISQIGSIKGHVFLLFL